VRSKAYFWKETNRIEIMNYVAFFLLQGLHQKPDNRNYFSQRKILEMPIFLNLISERRIHLLLKFFISLTVKRVNIMKQGTTAKTVGQPCVLHHFQCCHMAANL
jgi:hypothetical protein